MTSPIKNDLVRWHTYLLADIFCERLGVYGTTNISSYLPCLLEYYYALIVSRKRIILYSDEENYLSVSFIVWRLMNWGVSPVSLLPPPPSRPRPHSPHSQTMTGKQNVTVTPKLSDLSSYFHHLSGVQIKKAICIDLVTNWWHRACGYSEEILNFLQRDEE